MVRIGFFKGILTGFYKGFYVKGLNAVKGSLKGSRRDP